MAERIMVIDDEAYMLELLARIIRENTAYEVEPAQNPVEALQRLAGREFDLALLDLKMPEMDGMQVLGRIRKLEHPPAVIIVTAYGTIRSAVQAMKEGAVDYVTKPFDTDEILMAIDRAVRVRRLERENRLLREQVEERLRGEFLLGSSEQVRRLSEEIGRLSAADVPVLIEGEVGTGKELVARVIHNASPRSQGPFVAFFCGGLTPAAAEAELFGGGARRGAVAEASGGTLYLAEVGQLPAPVQARLVRLLEEGRFEVSGGEMATADCRMLVSTTESLTELARAQKFSQDLLFRLNTIHLVLPPLRSRKEDIPLLAHHFAQRFCARYGRPGLSVSPGALEWLLRQDWPGNVRELRNVLERGVVLAAGPELALADLFPSDYLNSVAFSPEAAVFEQPWEAARQQAAASFGRTFEAEYLRLLLARTRGNLSAAARESGLAETELAARLSGHGIDAAPFRRGLL
jgi:DNA-binding NtrC family response regulator